MGSRAISNAPWNQLPNLLKTRPLERSIREICISDAGKKLVALLLRGYKWAISPMLLPACRYVPTCSEYAMEAVERYGVLHGGAKAAWRLLRCHPFAKGGVDPVVKIPSGMISKPDFCNH